MSENKARRVDFYPDEYIAGIGGVLRADEQGVYWMLCSLIMSEGGAVEFNVRRLSALCQLRPAQLRKIVTRLIEMGKISQQNDGKLCQKRAQNEVERSLKRIQSAQENGSKGGRPSEKDQQNQQKAKAGGSDARKLTTNYQLATSNLSNKSTKSRKRHSYTEAFETFWSAYPTDALMSKQEASKAFEALDEETQQEAINSLPAFQAHCRSHPDYRPVHANRYLKQQRFDGFNKQAQATNRRVFVEKDTETWRAITKHRGTNSLPVNESGGWWFDKGEVETARSQIKEFQ